jgi:lipopolysaccharide export system permease protein
MNTLQRYLTRQFVPVCIVALVFFVMLLELGDLFANLWKYLSNDVPISSIFKVMWLYIPKCVSYSMPMAVLFASSYTMGNMYSRNELTSIFSSGYPLYFLIVPLLILGMILSFGMFFFEDRVVIDSLAAKNKLNKVLLKQEESLSNTNIVVLSESGKIVYTADYYQDADKKLFTVLVIVRTASGNPEYILRAPIMTWDGKRWVPENYSYYEMTNPSEVIMKRIDFPVDLTEPPETFKRNTTTVDEISAAAAKVYIANMRKAGLPFAEQLANYYKRFSFPFTIFIVLFFSISLGGKFKKNILLMSLVVSLSVAVLYYVTQMISMLFAKWGYISPLAGAWFPVLLFVAAGAVILRYART